MTINRKRVRSTTGNPQLWPVPKIGKNWYGNWTHPSNARKLSKQILFKNELVPGDICACRSRICIKLVYKTKTRCNEDQMRKHTENLHKEANALHSSKARLKKVRLRSTLVQLGSFQAITTFGKKSQTSPHNRLLQSNLVLALNPSENFVLGKSHRPLLIST